MPTSGYRIRALRTVLKLNQTEFARRLGVTQGTVSDWETAKTDPGRGMLRLMADLCQESEQVFSWLETGRPAVGLKPRGMRVRGN